MTAHDDDQDLVTIRLPRRAAALYATELEVAASPWLVKLSVWGGIVAPIAGFIIALVFLIAGFYQAACGDTFFAINCFVMSAIAGALSSILAIIGFQRLRIVKRRGLL